MVEMGDCIPATPVCISTESFYLCGSSWKMLVYPYGLDEIGDSLAIRLRNMSSKSVDCAYKLDLKKLPTDTACIKFDTDEDADPPSSFAGNEVFNDIFDSSGTKNDEYGIEDLILIDELSPLLINDTLVVKVYMEVFGEVDLSAHPLTMLIESGEEVSERDLTTMADKDLVLLKKGNSGPGIGVVSSRQDSIVSKRGAEPEKDVRKYFFASSSRS